VSNVTLLFPPGVTIKEIYAVVDEIADAEFKKRGLLRGPVWLAVTEDIAREICARKNLPFSEQGFHFTATLMNVVAFRLGTLVLDLHHLNDLFHLGEMAAKHGLLPTEDEYEDQLSVEDSDDE
jgi:hypothetical protein